MTDSTQKIILNRFGTSNLQYFIQFLSILLYSSMILLFSQFSSYSSWLTRLYNGFIHLRYDINQIYRPTFYNLKGTKFWWCSPGKLICAQIRLNVHWQMNQSLRSHSHSSFRVLSSYNNIIDVKSDT